MRADWLAQRRLAIEVLFTSEQPKKNKMALVGILSQIKLLHDLFICVLRYIKDWVRCYLVQKLSG